LNQSTAGQHVLFKHLPYTAYKKNGLTIKLGKYTKHP